MTKEELQQEVQNAVKMLETLSKDLASTVEVLRKTAHQDANFAALESIAALLESLPETNVKGAVVGVRKALVARSNQRIKELSR